LPDPPTPHDKALRLYPLPTREIAPTTIHQDVHIILSNDSTLGLSPDTTTREQSRPYVVLNMVGTVDGKVAIGGRASGIGSEIDRHTMRNLRAGSDAVMIGAGTLRAERLSLGLDETARSGRLQPLAIILTTTGEDVPLESNLILHEDQKLLVVAGTTIHETNAERLRARASVLRITSTPNGCPDLEETLRALKREHAVERLLVEGGPTLGLALISAGLADELFLTIAPKLIGGTTPEARTLLDATLQTPQDLRLLSIHIAADELFLRYAITHAST